MTILVSDLVARVEKRLRLVSGLAVQVYAEDQILHSIQTAFDRLFIKRFWPAYSSWVTWTLDGTTGQVTADLTSTVKDFTDIQLIWYESDRKPIPRLPVHMTPAMTGTGTRVRYWEPLSQTPAKVFRVLPVTATGDITARIRTKPADFATDDTIYLDSLLLELASALVYLAADNANPTWINITAAELKTHYDDLDNLQDDDRIELTGEYGGVLEEWSG